MASAPDAARCRHRQETHAGRRGFFFVRPAGRTHLEVQVLYQPDKGSRREGNFAPYSMPPFTGRFPPFAE